MMGPPEFSKWMQADFEVVLFVFTIVAAIAILVVFAIKPAALCLPTKDFQCTESSIVNGSAECVRYERREK